MKRSNTAPWLLALAAVFMCLVALVAALMWVSGRESGMQRADVSGGESSAESTPDAPVQTQEASESTPVEKASETDHATDRAAEETLDLNERGLNPGDGAQQTVDAAGDRERVDDAIDSATGETLDLHWLQTLDAATAEKLAQWGQGDDGVRVLTLARVRTLDAATAEELVQWGSGDDAFRWLWLGDRAQRAVDSARER